jgi:hypothetical protein
MRNHLYRHRALSALQQQRNGMAVVRVGTFRADIDGGAVLAAFRRRISTTPIAEAIGGMKGGSNHGSQCDP